MSDPNLLEFWGNYLIAVARGQKQLQDVDRWVRRNFEGMEDLAAMFKQAYGLDRYPTDSQTYQDAWRAATSEFRQSFKEMFKSLGWVPQEDYRELEEQNRQLQQKVAEQDRAIETMQALLEQKGFDQTKTVEVFRELVHKQGEEFHKLMRAFQAAPPEK